MENLFFEKKSVFSKTLNKEIELETYESNGKCIITSNSLISVFRDIRAERGISTRKHFHVSYGNDGLPAHILCIYTLKDKNGYEEDSTGEYSALNQSSELSIASEYRGKLAERRAESEGIINYLGLPGKCYSSDEIAIQPQAEDVQKELLKTGQKENDNNTDTSSQNPVSAPISDSPVFNPDTENDEEAKTVTESDKQSMPDENATNTPPIEKNQDDSISLKTVIGFGPVADLTIEEAMTSPRAKQFLNLIKTGAIHKPSDKRGEIITFIEKQLNS